VITIFTQMKDKVFFFFLALICEVILNSCTLCLTGIRQILEKKWEYNEAVHHLFIDFKKVYYSVSRGVF
jgi:hypothetical protein